MFAVQGEEINMVWKELLCDTDLSWILGVAGWVINLCRWLAVVDMCPASMILAGFGPRGSEDRSVVALPPPYHHSSCRLHQTQRTASFSVTYPSVLPQRLWSVF